MSNIVSITQAIRIMVHRLSRNPALTFLLEGPPGVAKTAIQKTVYELLQPKLGLREFIAVKLANKSPEAIGGYPMQGDDNRLIFSEPGWYPTAEYSYLFIDEVGQCPPAVQNVIMSAADERKIGEHKLPDNTIVVMAANRATDRAGSTALTTAFRSRFDCVLEIDPAKDEFIEHATSNGFYPALIAAVSKLYDNVVDFNPKNKGGFLTLRTLEQASRALYDYDGDPHHPDLKVCLHSVLGSDHASRILGFIETVASRPDYSDIVADPDGTVVEIAMVEPISKDIASSIKYAHVPKVIRYIKRYPAESQAAIISRLPDTVTSHPDIEELSESLGL